MNLGELADTISDSDVTGFALDHRKVAPGNVFGAFRGARFNGEDFIDEAVRRGAVAVVAEPKAKVVGVPHLAADEPRYVVVVMLDEPHATAETFGFHTAGWNVAPVVSKTIGRIAPMLGVRPDMRREPNMAEVLPYVHEKAGH